MYRQRLKEYIEEDVIYQAYKEQKEFETSDFDNFCILHCEDIEEALFDLEQLRKENNQFKEQYCERTDCGGRLGNSKKVERLENTIKELRSWLEDEIKEIDRHTTTLDIFNTYDYETIHEMETKKITYKNVLSKLNELESGKNK